MKTVLWDASALVKRYAPETGSDIVGALSSAVPPSRMIATVLGYAETYSALLRRYHRGAIRESAFLGAKSLLRREVINDPEFTLLTLDDASVLDGLRHVDNHHLNATDAGFLALYIRHAQALRADGRECVLVAADRRLLRAAEAEGLAVLDPEVAAPGDVATITAAR
ncbi:MAG: type II toxin-antitoxin system VapC family toxin [Armatimonadetes bacterium]|nr:type II toxin-antitoxin system VapC family toxin [Armatimonadota bacterium]